MDKFGIIEEGCIHTYSGKTLNLLNPDPNCIDIESIANGLSKICRFGGQIHKHYSVAEHSILACHEAWQNDEKDEIIKGILLHDAAEAYLGDIVKPLKNCLPQYLDIERKMEEAIEKRFNIELFDNWKTIKKYDNGMYLLENKIIRKNINKFIPDKDEYIEIRRSNIQYLDHKEACLSFINWFKFLRIK
jgi:5'-deoxynucleotidase YfbR-like HD superfamily hydrolase